VLFTEPIVTLAVITFTPVARVIEPDASPVSVSIVVAPFFNRTVAAEFSAVAVPVSGELAVVTV
jgi:hypothetical protein